MNLPERRKSSATSTIGKVAAHIPDLIVYGDFSQDVPFIENFDGVLLFADISGFTALTEKFSMDTSMEHGADQLTQTLNHYVGDIVEEVLIHGGDILNFAGDALLALWRVERVHLSHIITLALQCSLSIQEAYGVRETEVGQELRVKIGLSAGHISKVVVGDNKHQYFLVIGRAVDEVRLAQSLANASEVILSPNCWELCDRNMIETERIKGQRAVKVRYLKNIFPLDSLAFKEYTRYLRHYPDARNLGVLRKVSMVDGNNELEKCLRKYVMRNILKKIDDNQPLEYLSELRPVTIVFVNLQFDESASTLHLSKAIQDASLRIAELIHSHRGKINKVFMFDKGCTFLCVFGLPGDKQPDETTHALDSAFKIFKYCSAMLMKIKLVSIGVTSGPVFCGVVGHRVRHEYTVIGQKVNLAARMMMYYPGVVSCDATTYTSSRLPNYFFKELPQTEMKGVANPGVVYHYLGISEKTTIGKATLTTERSEYYPLLGREKEINLFQTSLKKFMGSTEGCVIMFEGLMGYGKSQLLTEIAHLGMEAGHKVVAMELTKINVNQNFFGIRALMAMFLGIDACKSYDARQHTLQSKLRDVADETCYCLLNNLFLVKFPISEEVSKMDSEERKIKMEKFLMEILQTAVKKDLLIFVIDEAQFIDSASWEYLENLLSKVPIFMIMALSPFHYRARQPCPSAVNIIKSPQTTYVQLRELKPSVILQKACQDLGVVSIPRELETFLIQRSHGIPYYCEELLRNLYLHNALMFHVLDEEEEIEDEWERLFTNPVKGMTFKTSSSISLESAEKELYICTICQNVKLQNITLPPSLKGIALAEIDNMSPSEQMVVKCAAVIGQNFTTELLFHILPEWTKNKMIQTLAALVEANIFKCFHQGREFQIAVEHGLSSLDIYDPVRKMNLTGKETGVQMSVANRIRLEQAVMQCCGMGFCMALMQEAAYELWLKSQKEALHHKCGAYLQKQAHKCKRCGEGDFISFHRYAIEMTLEIPDDQELVFEEPEEYPFSEAASLVTAIALGKIESPSFEGIDRKVVPAEMCSEENNTELNEEIPESRNKLNTIFSGVQSYLDTAAVVMRTISRHSPSRIFRPLDEDIHMPIFSRRHGSVAQNATEDHHISAFSRGLGSIIPHIAEDIGRLLKKDGTLLEENLRAEAAQKEFLDRMDEIIRLFGQGRGKITYMASCECEQIVASVFMPLARHCMAIGDEDRALYYLLECAAAYLRLSNNYMAFMNLNIAESLIKSLDPRRNVISPFEEATFYSLKGEVCYNMGQMKLAKKMFKKALSLLGRKFPLTSIGVFFKTVTEMSKHASQQKNQPCPHPSKTGEKKLACLYQQNHCLSLLWQIFSQDSANTSRKFSQLAALMSVNSAEESEDEHQIISSYIEYALCCQTIGCQDDWMKYELMAIQRSSHLKLVGGGLLTTIKLAQSLAYIKHCLGNLPLSIELGYRAHEICLHLKKPNQDYMILSVLFQSLFLSMRNQECKQVLQWLEKLAIREEKILAQACLFSSCLDLLLYAGWTYKPFKECLEFVQQNETNCILMSQSGIMLGLYSSLAIWFARLQQWDNFREPFEKARRLMRRTSASLFAAYGCCSFLECHILRLHNHAEIKPQKVRETRTRVLKTLEEVFSRCSTSPIYYARIYHLKAYVFLMLGHEEQSQFYLEKGLEVSDMYGNFLERSWLEISDEWWFTAREPMEDLWLKTAPDFPTWEGDLSEAEIRKFHRTKYLMRAPALDVDNPFPEEK
ncbi:adenylate cyclase type 10 isoform C [Alligator mississippiensis]|uniref:Adenylate cyclase type 10 isoform C n=1 Tax=Alligator mississippiensis TaxID=8496 RepID=A0A151MIJ9_ALLMI|nr:adenylate cyclase type 10 isoform C [Alligator mississippiensis]